MARLDIKVPPMTKAGAKALAKANYQTVNKFVAQLLDERIAAAKRGIAA
jgi:hypothetical protein